MGEPTGAAVCVPLPDIYNPYIEHVNDGGFLRGLPSDPVGTRGFPEARGRAAAQLPLRRRRLGRVTDRLDLGVEPDAIFFDDFAS